MPISKATVRRKVRRAVELLEKHYGKREIIQSGRPLESLIGTILSQNTSDVNSHRAHAELRRRFPSMKALAKATPRQIETAIRSGGLARQKSRRIAALLRELPLRGGSPSLSHIARMGDDDAIRAMTAIKGVGLKTAACVLLFAVGRDVCPVDTHVARIASRVPLAPDARTAVKVYHGMGELIPPGRAGIFHVSLIRLGRELCRARAPRCGECPLRRICCKASTARKAIRSG